MITEDGKRTSSDSHHGKHVQVRNTNRNSRIRVVACCGAAFGIRRVVVQHAASSVSTVITERHAFGIRRVVAHHKTGS